MENSTKALLIAAAVLTAIVIIAGGIAILRSASSSSSQAEDTGKVISMATDGAIKKFQKSVVSKEEFNEFVADIKNKYKSAGQLINTIMNTQNSKIRNQIELIGYIYNGKRSNFFGESDVIEANKLLSNLPKFGEYWNKTALPNLKRNNKLIDLSDATNINSIKSDITNFYNQKTGSSLTIEEYFALKLESSAYWFFLYDSDGYIYKACCIYSIQY